MDRIFWELNHKFDSFIKSNRRLMIVIGDPGIGKSYLISNRAANEIPRFEVNRGVSTPAGLNDFLGAFSDGYLLLLDDCEGWSDDKKAISIIKAGSETPFTVKWVSKDKRVEYKFWQNNSKWIIIMNEKPTIKMWRPIFSRAYTVEMNLTYHDKIKLLYEIAKIKKIPIQIPKFIEEQTNPSTEQLDIRTLEKGHEFFLTHPRKWQRLLLTELVKNPKKDFILRMMDEKLDSKEMIEKFKDEGYGSRATFYRTSQNLKR